MKGPGGTSVPGCPPCMGKLPRVAAHMEYAKQIDAMSTDKASKAKIVVGQAQ